MHHIEIEVNASSQKKIITSSLKHVNFLVYSIKEKSESQTSFCESILGIYPGHFDFSQLQNAIDASGSNVLLENRVMVKGFVMDEPSNRFQEIEIGDWLKEINNTPITHDNLEEVLSSISPKSMVQLTLQKLALQLNSNNSPSHAFSNNLESDSTILHDSLSKSYFSLLYLTLNTNSDDINEQDILYIYPQTSKIKSVRGLFITLSQIIQEITGDSILNSEILINQKRVYVGYCCIEQELLVVTVPADKINLPTLKKLVENLVRLIKILYQSLHSAFTEKTYHSKLDNMLALIFYRFQQNKSVTHGNYFHKMFNEARAVILPSQTKVTINDVLYEFESSDFADLSESYYNLRRLYSILGTCFFYKGYLLANHLPLEDLYDILVYIEYHDLRDYSMEELNSQLVVWTEIFPTRRCHMGVEPLLPSYIEPDGRWILMIIAMQGCLLCVILEAGGCCAIPDGNISPDPIYIEQAKMVIKQLNTSAILNLCDSRLQHCFYPSLASADWFNPLNSQKTKTLTLPPKSEKQSSQSHFSEYYKPNDSRLTTADELEQPSGVILDSDLPESLPTHSRLAADSFTTIDQQANEKSFYHRRNLPSVYDVNNLTRENVQDNSFSKRIKVVSGCDNTLFYFFSIESSQGIFLCPTDSEVIQVNGSLHSKVLDNFLFACMKIKSLLNTKLSQDNISDEKSEVYENGMLFKCDLTKKDNMDLTKKKLNSISYWVIGRYYAKPTSRHVFVCFLDSAEQTFIEMAFKLGYSVNI